MNIRKILLICLTGFLLTGCSYINNNIKFETIDIDIDKDGKRDYFFRNVYYNDVKYCEPVLSGEYYLYITEDDILLYRRNNFPMAGTTHIFANKADNPDYLFYTNNNLMDHPAYNIYFREDIDLNEEIFIYKDIEVNLYKEFVKVDEEYNSFLFSLEERKLINFEDNGEYIRFVMKEYPKVSFLMSLILYYDGKFYQKSHGYYYQLSDEFINLCYEKGYILNF